MNELATDWISISGNKKCIQSSGREES